MTEENLAHHHYELEWGYINKVGVCLDALLSNLVLTHALMHRWCSC